MNIGLSIPSAVWLIFLFIKTKEYKNKSQAENKKLRAWFLSSFFKQVNCTAELTILKEKSIILISIIRKIKFFK